MAAGDAGLLGWPYVNASTGRVKDGATEINTTRDLAAEVKLELDRRAPGKISIGPLVPLNNDGRPNGDIHFRIV